MALTITLDYVILHVVQYMYWRNIGVFHRVHTQWQRELHESAEGYNISLCDQSKQPYSVNTDSIGQIKCGDNGYWALVRLEYFTAFDSAKYSKLNKAYPILRFNFKLCPCI